MKNKYEILGEITVIHLINKTTGEEHVTLIDTDSLPLAQSFSGYWCYMYNGSKRSASVCGIGNDTSGKRRKYRLARMILRTPQHLIAEHVNRNPLDNRRTNLRNATNPENAKNRSRKGESPVLLGRKRAMAQVLCDTNRQKILSRDYRSLIMNEIF